MKRAFLLLLATATLCAGDDRTPFFDKIKADEFSPRSDILVEHYFERDGIDQIWLVSTADPAKRHLLFTHQRHAEVLFSRDEEWLVINNHNLSNEARLLLYRRKKGLAYEQVADLTEAAWQFFERRNGLKSGTGFDHSYVEALRWTGDDPPTLLLSLNGHSGSGNYTDEWCCFYDIRGKSFSTDLDAHNKTNTKLEAK